MVAVMRAALVASLLAGARAGVPVFTVVGESDPGSMFWRPGIAIPTGIQGHVAQHVTLAGQAPCHGRVCEQILLTKDGGKTYSVMANITSGYSDGNFNAATDLGTWLPPAATKTPNLSSGPSAAGEFHTIVGSESGPCRGGLCPSYVQTWEDGPAGLKLAANASASFSGTPPEFLATTGCAAAAGGNPHGASCWLSSPSQTVIRDANGSLLLSAYGYAADGKMLCGGGAKLCSAIAFFSSSDDGLTWKYRSRIDATAAMAAPDKRHGHSSIDIEGPGQASLVLLGDGRVMVSFRLGGPMAGGNESTIGPYFPGGNQGLNLWQAYSSDAGRTWSVPVSMRGCGGVRHDPKGVWPQLLMLSNGVLTLTTGRPNLQFWTSSVITNKSNPAAGANADGVCWSYSALSGAVPTDPYGKTSGTSGYTGVAEAEPGILLVAYDQLPVGPVGTPGTQRVYSMSLNMTKKKKSAA
jgi:hypothetical protein